MRNKILSFAVCLLLLLAQGISAKSIYPPNNYYEDGKHYPMCMRCHMLGPFNPAGVTLSLSRSAATVNPGQQVTVSATRGNFNSAWNPGVVIHFSNNDKYAQRIPQEYGWEVVSGPGGLPYNFHRVTNGANTLVWTLKAPKKPGQYLIATSAYFSDAGLPGTKRGDNTVTITVNKVAETQRPVVLEAKSLYKSYVFLKFSEPVDEALATTLANYTVTRAVGGQQLAITAAFMSRDGLQAVLKTADHLAGSTYSVSIRNLTDYALTANRLTDTSLTYTPDLVTPYIVPCNYSQDMTGSEIMFSDQVEYLGKDYGGVANRVNLSFYHTPTTDLNLDKPIDALTGISFVAARIYLRQFDSPGPVTGGKIWNAHTISGSLMAEAPVSELWGGMNQSATPVAVLSRRVDVVAGGVPETWWAWDVTQNFRSAYQSGGASQYRIKAETETTPGGLGFYGADADSAAYRPYIALLMDTTGATGGLANRPEISAGTFFLSSSPNPFNAAVTIRAVSSGISVSDGSRLSIFSIQGKKILELDSEKHSASAVDFVWDGKDGNGRKMPGGVYVALLKSAGARISCRLLLSE